MTLDSARESGILISMTLRRRTLWWVDYETGELVRTADNARWRVEEIPPMNVEGEVDVDAVDRWVAAQPKDSP